VTWLIVVGVLSLALLAWWRFDRAARVPQVGDAAPDFSLPDQHGKMRALAEFRRKWLALYFFPRADTPG
jgi:thioredoxin-dependent peroxiredoxin